MANRLLATAGLLLVTGLRVVGQPATAADAPGIRFSVVSVKENRSDNQKMSYAIPRDGDSISYTNYPLFYLVIYSNDFHRSDLVFGLPQWTKDTRYDIVAKVAPEDVERYRALPVKERLAMFQQVLADRFKLRFHIEPRELPAIEMTIAKGGPKLKAADPDKPLGLAQKYGQTILRLGPGDIEGEGGTISDLAMVLTAVTQGRQIVDKTGLTGKYDFSIKYAPDTESASPEAEPDMSSAAAPSLPTALKEQLGIQLRSGKATFDCFVVDHIEHPTPD